MSEERESLLQDIYHQLDPVQRFDIWPLLLRHHKRSQQIAVGGQMGGRVVAICRYYGAICNGARPITNPFGYIYIRIIHALNVDLRNSF